MHGVQRCGAERSRERHVLTVAAAAMRPFAASTAATCSAVLQENVTLINELNALRKELKDIRGALSDLESAMGFHRRNQKMSTVEILRLIASTTKNAQMEREVEESRQVSVQ